MPNGWSMTGRDLLLLCVLSAWAGGGFAIAPAATVIGFCAVLGVLRAASVVRTRGATVIVILFTAGGLRSVAAEREARSLYETALTIASPPVACRLEGTVVASPQAQGDRYRTAIDVERGVCGDSQVPSGVRVSTTTDVDDLRRGDRVALEGTLSAATLFDNPELVPAWIRLARTRVALGASTSGGLVVVERGGGLASWIDGARNHVRRRIRATYHREADPLGRALVLGETDLDEEVSEAFRATGLSHVLAVSGTHLVVAVLALTGALHALLLRWSRLAARMDTGRLASAFAIPCAWLYADFAGGSGSVVRAAAMMTAVLGARVLERRPRPSRSLAAAMGLGVVMDPVVVADISFTLSTAATCGLLVLQRPIAALLGVREAADGEGVSLLRRAWNALAGASATTLGATFACAPVTAALSPQLPVAGVAANLLAAPLGEVVALPFAMAHVALGAAPPLELGAARIASGALRAVLGAARFARDLGATVGLPAPTAYHLVTIAVGFTLAVCARTRARAWASVGAMAVGLVAVELGVRERERPTGVLRVSVLDVGQGDAIAIDLPDGSFMLIDAGGFPGQKLDVGARVIAPVLRARRRSRIDFLVLSHPHPDHYGGFATTIARADSIGQMWDNGASGEHENREVAALKTAAREKGAILLEPSTLCGAPREIGGALIELLSPCPEVDPGESINDGSLVLKITYGRRSVLLMGDAETAAEDRLLASSAADLRADVLKVGHHGSKTSTTPELLHAVAPTYAVVSCGARNRFGHPHAEAMEALRAAGVSVARTDSGGAWSFTTDGDAISVSR